MEKQKSKNGYTIIEIVMVLAIAGLIFIMIFIALPSLRRAQRDAARRNDVTIIAAAVRQYMKNNHGQGPPSTGKESDTTTVFDDTDERSQFDWSTGKDSQELRRYLSGLNEDVTTIVAVRNFVRDQSRVRQRYTIGEPTKSGTVYVNIGARCPEGDPQNEMIVMNITRLNTDVAIFRYLESGYFYCHNM